MLRIFRAVLEEKEIPAEKLKRLHDKDFIKDVSLAGYTDETLILYLDILVSFILRNFATYGLQGCRF